MAEGSIESSSSSTLTDVTSDADKAFIHGNAPSSDVVDFIANADEYQSLIEMSVVGMEGDRPEQPDATSAAAASTATAAAAAKAAAAGEDDLDEFLRSMYGEGEEHISAMFEEDEDSYASATRINGVVNPPVVVTKDDVLAGGALSKDTVDFDIRTYTLHPNPIISRLEHIDPPLFTAKGKQTYAQSCQATHRKQPVAFSEEEMKHVRKHHRAAYGEELLYRGHYYICPRFFSIRHNVPLTQEQVKSNKYGLMLPLKLPNKRGQSRLDPNANIIEFTSKDHIDKHGNYIHKSPGLMKPSKHPHGLCMPCCVSSFNGDEQVRRRQQCIERENDAERTIHAEIPSVQKHYILGPVKTSIPYHRYGQITPHIASLLGRPSSGHAFVRYGTNHDVFSPACKSFLSAIADVYSQGKMTLSEMRAQLLKAVTLDHFVAAQKGGLVKIFANLADVGDLDPDSAEGKEAMRPHERTVVYGKLSGQGKGNDHDHDRRTLLIMCIACNNFRDYVNHTPCADDDGHFLDYRYLWDLVCMPNPNLFQDGINLILLKSSNDVDITSNVRMVCPTGSSNYADMKRGFVIVYKNGATYDPIYVVKLSKDGESVHPGSVERVVRTSQFPALAKTFQHLVDAMQSACATTGIAGYKFEQPAPAGDVARAAQSAGYTILQQLLHYTGPVVALHVRGPTSCVGVVPTAPSAALPDVDAAAMDYRLPVWNDYAATYAFLAALHDATRAVARCKPAVKVVEQGMVVGLLTVANQFVPIAAPELNTQSDGLPVVDGYNYAEIDAEADAERAPDDDEKLYLRLKLETEYYRCFKSVVNKHMKSYQLDEHHKNIRDILDNEAYDVPSRIKSVVTLLRDLFGGIVTFSEFSERAVEQLLLAARTASTRKETLCSIMMHEATTPVKHVFPKRNIVDRRDNEELYYHRYADEIIRYPFLRLHIMQRTNDMPLANLEWSVDESEILTTPSKLESAHMQKRSELLADGAMYLNYPRDMRGSHYGPDEAQYKATNVFGILKELLNVEAQELVRTGATAKESISMFAHLFEYSAIESYYTSDTTSVLDVWRHQGKGVLIDRLTTITTASILHAVLKSDEHFVTLMDYVAAANSLSYGLIVYFTSLNQVIQSNITLINPAECNGYLAMIKVSNNIVENTPQDIRVVLIDGKSPFVHQSTIPDKLRAAIEGHRHTYEEYMRMYKEHLERSKSKIAVVRDRETNRIKLKVKVK